MQISDGERLILLMLCDLHKHLQVESETDPEFIADAVRDGHLWALKWEYPGIFHGEDTNDRVVGEVGEILTMWRVIEDTYAKLGDDDRRKVEEAAGSRELKFFGFDGNNETSHMSAAAFMIERLGRFEEFRGRELNSHCPTLEVYRRMVAAFTPMLRRGVGSNRFSADDLIEILRERVHPERRDKAGGEAA